MTAVPRRLVILGAGPVGVEMAQVVRRLGGEAVMADHGAHVLAREPAPLGRHSAKCCAETASSWCCRRPATRARRDGGDFVLDFEDDREARGDRLLVATGRRPRVEEVGPANARAAW